MGYFIAIDQFSYWKVDVILVFCFVRCGSAPSGLEDIFLQSNDYVAVFQLSFGKRALPSFGLCRSRAILEAEGN